MKRRKDSWNDKLREIERALRRGFFRGEEWARRFVKRSKRSPTQKVGDHPASDKPSAGPVSKSAIPAAEVMAPTIPPTPRPSETTRPPFRPRIDDGYALNLPEWADIGRSLQHPEFQGGRSTPMTVRIGVDFGTAFTKVAIRAGVDLVPVDWSDVTGDDSQVGRFLVPGFVVRTPDGEFCWRRLAKADIRGNLKLPIIEMAGSDECPIATVAYLALVIRYARAFLYRKAEIGRKLMARSLRWELNIGCPTEPHEKSEVVDIFRRIARTAWLLAAKDRFVEQDVLQAWSLADLPEGLETEPGVVPEFVAQIAGYLGSPQVKEGLHALIDIGAATLDVATFNIVLHKDRDSPPRIPIFFSKVRPLGTHYLRHDRHSKLGLDLSWNDAEPVEPPDDFGRRNGKSPDEVMNVDKEFIGEVAECVFGVIDSTRISNRGDSSSPAWKEGLPIFVTGGGSSCNTYRQAIKEAETKLIGRLHGSLGHSINFRFIELDPTSGELQHVDIEAGKRLTVALGLTEDAENIAKIVPHRDIEPIRYTVRERVDHTDLYGDR